jgi:hypothetical protein
VSVHLREYVKSSDHGLDVGPDDRAWWHRAACNRGDAAMRDTWWTKKDESVATARHVCLYHCPVLLECNTEATQRRPDDGVWGGILWVRVRNRSGLGREAINQPLHEGCGKRCRGWRE